MKTNKVVDDKFKWNLKDIYESDEEVYKTIEKLKEKIKLIPQFKGKLNKPKKCLELFKLEDEIDLEFANVSIYSLLKKAEDVASQKYTEMEVVVGNLANFYAENSVFVEPELNGMSEKYLKKLINNPEFKNYAFGLELMIRNKPHILSEKEEKILTKTSKFSDDFSDIFSNIDNVDLKFKDAVDSKGKKHLLTNATYSALRESKDRTLRKSASLNLLQGFKSLANTIATNYIGNLKSDWFYSEIRNYKSTLGASLFAINMDESVYNKLIENVHNNIPALKKYYKLRKKLLNLSQLWGYDLLVPLTKYAPKIEFLEGVEIVKSALSVLGEDYIKIVQRSVDERWVDVYPAENKESGAFNCGGAYNVHPYVLMNYVNNIDGVFTFAHEIGHSVHSYLSNKNQPQSLSHYPIVLAEIASTVNEVLLLKYFYANAKTKEEKIHFLDEYIRMFTSTIFTQTKFSEFEEYAHKLIENDEPISKEILNNYYGYLNQLYEGKEVKTFEESCYAWMRIPHFYNSFYVFKYATGMISAISIAKNILNSEPNAKERYFEMLKAGGSDFPLKLLENAGVDLSSDKPYIDAFNELKWAINELEKLVK